jgi:hypothetical protein
MCVCVCVCVCVCLRVISECVCLWEISECVCLWVTGWHNTSITVQYICVTGWQHKHDYNIFVSLGDTTQWHNTSMTIQNMCHWVTWHKHDCTLNGLAHLPELPPEEWSGSLQSCSMQDTVASWALWTYPCIHLGVQELVKIRLKQDTKSPSETNMTTQNMSCRHSSSGMTLHHRLYNSWH